jgi:hypothetical protein
MTLKTNVLMSDGMKFLILKNKPLGQYSRIDLIVKKLTLLTKQTYCSQGKNLDGKAMLLPSEQEHC